LSNDLAHGLRGKLLASASTTAINEDGDTESAMYNEAKQSKNPLAALLSKLKESQAQDDDNFRA